MTKSVSTRLDHHFADLADPRQRQVVYPLLSLVTLAICASRTRSHPEHRVVEFGLAA